MTMMMMSLGAISPPGMWSGKPRKRGVIYRRCLRVKGRLGERGAREVRCVWLEVRRAAKKPCGRHGRDGSGGGKARMAAGKGEGMWRAGVVKCRLRQWVRLMMEGRTLPEPSYRGSGKEDEVGVC